MRSVLMEMSKDLATKGLLPCVVVNLLMNTKTRDRTFDVLIQATLLLNKKSIVE